MKDLDHAHDIYLLVHNFDGIFVELQKQVNSLFNK